MSSLGAHSPTFTAWISSGKAKCSNPFCNRDTINRYHYRNPLLNSPQDSPILWTCVLAPSRGIDPLWNRPMVGLWSLISLHTLPASTHHSISAPIPTVAALSHDLHNHNRITPPNDTITISIFLSPSPMVHAISFSCWCPSGIWRKRRGKGWVSEWSSHETLSSSNEVQFHCIY